MATIQVRGPGSTSLDGMPTTLRQRTALGPIRNGRRCTARPVSAVEYACQYLTARRRLPLMSHSALILHHTSTGPVTYPVARVRREEYSQYLTAIVLYATQTVEIYPVFSFNTTELGATWHPTSPVSQPPTSALTRAAAIASYIEGITIGGGDALDLNYTDINIGIDTTFKAGGSAGNIYVFSVSLFSVPMSEIVI